MADHPKRRGTDWTLARDEWLAQTPPRSFDAIGRRFGFSGQRVGQIARRDNWRAAGEKLDAEVLRRSTARIVRSRSDRVVKVLGLIDGALDVYDAELEAKAHEARLRDMPDMVKLGELLLGEATDRVSSVEAQEMFAALMAVAVVAIQEGWKVARFIATVRETLGPAGGELEAA